MQFVFPSRGYKKRAIRYIREFWECGSDINGTGGLDRYLKEATYEEWLQKIRADVDVANAQPGRVPASTYFYVGRNDGEIIGMLNIRPFLNDFLKKEGGHIGYSIRPSQRRKGYGTRMLQEALNFLRPIGLTDVLISCGQGNPGSARVIINCGGILEEEFYSETFGEVIQRYRIRGTDRV